MRAASVLAAASIALAFLVSACTCCAGVVWETRRIEATASPDRPRMDFDFRFRNAGPTAVRVLRVGTDCDCTTAAADKTIFAAGESGTVHVQVVTGALESDRRRTVFVTTSDDPECPVRLTLKIKAHVLATIEPRVLLLDSSNASAPQYFTVRIQEGLVGKVQSVKCEGADLAASIEPVEAGRLYRVGVTCARTDRPRSVDIEILVEVNSRTVAHPATVIFRPGG